MLTIEGRGARTFLRSWNERLAHRLLRELKSLSKCNRCDSRSSRGVRRSPATARKTPSVASLACMLARRLARAQGDGTLEQFRDGLEEVALEPREHPGRAQRVRRRSAFSRDHSVREARGIRKRPQQPHVRDWVVHPRAASYVCALHPATVRCPDLPTLSRPASSSHACVPLPVALPPRSGPAMLFYEVLSGG